MTHVSVNLGHSTAVHGHAGHCGRGRSPTYHSWQSMIARCTRRTHAYYYIYGGRGIKVCTRWRVFKNFLADMGPRPSKDHTLERRNGNRGYSKKNCYWATWSEQNRNRDFERQTMAVNHHMKVDYENKHGKVKDDPAPF